MITPMQTRYAGYRFRSKHPPLAPRKVMAKRADRAGRCFGRLVVEKDLGVAVGGSRWWGCVCICGERVAVRAVELDRGHTQSCGCLAAENRKLRPGKNKLPEGEASFRVLFGAYRRSAKYRGLVFDLSEDEFRAITRKDCAYCGSPPATPYVGAKGMNGPYIGNGVDRFHNEVGYTLENSRPCCTECNMAKGKMLATRWRAWLICVAIKNAPQFAPRREREAA